MANAESQANMESQANIESNANVEALYSFKIVVSNLRLQRHKPISHFYKIEKQLLRSGLHGLRSIVFYFDTSKYNYPYGIHPIILEHRNHHLHIVFYHYYTAKNQRAELHIDQRIADYYVLLDFLEKRQSPVLYYLLPPVF